MRRRGGTGRNKYVGLLLAYKWPIIGALAAVFVIGVGTLGYLTRQKRPEPSVLLAEALKLLNDRQDPEAIPEAQKDCLGSSTRSIIGIPHFIGAVPYILGITDFAAPAAN